MRNARHCGCGHDRSSAIRSGEVPPTPHLCHKTRLLHKRLHIIHTWFLSIGGDTAPQSRDHSSRTLARWTISPSRRLGHATSHARGTYHATSHARGTYHATSHARGTYHATSHARGTYHATSHARGTYHGASHATATTQAPRLGGKTQRTSIPLPAVLVKLPDLCFNTGTTPSWQNTIATQISRSPRQPRCAKLPRLRCKPHSKCHACGTQHGTATAARTTAHHTLAAHTAAYLTIDGVAPVAGPFAFYLSTTFPRRRDVSGPSSHVKAYPNLLECCRAAALPATSTRPPLAVAHGRKSI